MSKIVWGAPSTRVYEAGLDCGVLFPPTGPGVAWNGLITINEKIANADTRPYYQDGIKYLNVAVVGEFEATIDAYTYPDEFAVCDGTVNLGGLSFHQQTPKPFDLVYRTKIGDETSEDVGYKLHLIYKALAVPTDKAHTTLTDAPDTEAFSWAVTTTPVTADGMRPTAYVSITSTSSTPTQMRVIEEHIYGTATKDPAMPTMAQLIDWFAYDLNTFTITGDTINGLSSLSDSGITGDLIGSSSSGLYFAPEETRLTESETGLYTLGV